MNQNNKKKVNEPIVFLSTIPVNKKYSKLNYHFEKIGTTLKTQKAF